MWYRSLVGTHRKLQYITDHLWQPYLLCKRSSPSRRIARLVKGTPIFERSAKLMTEWMSERGRCQISNAEHALCPLGCWAGRRGKRKLYLVIIGGKKNQSYTARFEKKLGSCSVPAFRNDKMAASGNRKQQQMAVAALPEEMCAHPESRTGVSRLLKWRREKGMRVEGQWARKVVREWQRAMIWQQRPTGKVCRRQET